MAAAGNGRQGASTPAMCEAPTSGASAPSVTSTGPPGGFPCPVCGARSGVMDSRPRLHGWHRRRQCAGGHRFSTIEVVYTNDLEVALAFKRRATPLIEALTRLAEGLDL